MCHFQVGDTGSQVLEQPSTWLSGRRLPSCRPRSSWFTVSRQHDAGHPSHDGVNGRQSICHRRTTCLEQPSSCHPWSVTVVVNLRKAAENLFVCLRVAALVTYELAPWKCTKYTAATHKWVLLFWSFNLLMASNTFVLNFLVFWHYLRNRWRHLHTRPYKETTWGRLWTTILQDDFQPTM